MSQKPNKVSSGYFNLPVSPYFIYVPLVLFAGTIQYFGGLNEIMVEIMSYHYYNYGLIHGGKSVYTEMKLGKLKGFTSISREGREFHEFLGIPYAKSPVGEFRFQPPVKAEKWEGVRDATGYGYICPQYDLFLQATHGHEDCLVLNVYTNSLPQFRENHDTRLRPVIVFIHGGMYMFGRGSDYRAEYFLDHDVVFVIINYRLGIFGFLNTGDGVVRGNMGLKDQVMALKWVRDNIADFGGDPNMITLMGESAGGASVHLHTLSPMSKGLFHRAITMSGTSLNQWSFIRKPKEQAVAFAKKLNCPTSSSEALVSCLRGISTWKITEVFRDTQDLLHDRLDVFAPTIESGYEHENDTETFLIDHPRNLLRRGEIISKVPIISGVNSQEGLIYAGSMVRNQTCVNELNKDWARYAPALLDYEHLSQNSKNDVSNRIWNYYFGNNTIGMDSMYKIVDLFSDACFFHPLTETAQLHSKIAPVYLYHYDNRGVFGLGQVYMRLSLKIPILADGLIADAILMFRKYVLGYKQNHWGVCHGDEMSLFFRLHPLLSTIWPGHPDYEFSKQIVRLWSEFAENGIPSDVDGSKWTPVQQGKPLEYMQLAYKDKSGMIRAPFEQRLRFWNVLPGFECLGSKVMNGTICLP